MCVLNACGWLLLLCGGSSLALAGGMGRDQAEEGWYGHGLMQLYGVYAHNANIPSANQPRDVAALSPSMRLIGDGKLSASWSWEGHLLLGYVPAALQAMGTNVMRSRALERSADRGRAFALVDRLNGQYMDERWRVKLGRQPVNLATNFFFMPNDFFAPFAAQSFYRAYKPGVDALRVDYAGDDLQQFTWLTVLGYQSRSTTAGQMPASVTQMSARNSSHLLRASTQLEAFEVGVLAGRAGLDPVVGGNLQTEFAEGIALRVEGNVRAIQSPTKMTSGAISVGVQRYVNERLSLLGEYLFQRMLNPWLPSSTMVKHDLATTLHYDWTPLLQTELAVVVNGVDRSGMWMGYATYSLNDESEMAIAITQPMGRSQLSSNPLIPSEFGAQPWTVSWDWRSYF
ncbi:MAG: hypothetical protein HQM07_09395 [Zetaproteobacteria bacterium]|nr:hypothetical protein [Zetaproteobacteria bacterium]